MKTKFTFTAIFALLFGGLSFAQNQSDGTLNTTISPPSTIVIAPNVEAFRFKPGLVTQLDAGTDFDFTTNSQWASFGRLTFPFQTVYGYRAQRAGRGLIFGYTGPAQSSTPTLGIPIIEWVGNGTVTAGDLLFRTSPSATSAVSTQVLKLREDATALLSSTSNFEAGTLSTNYPKVYDLFLQYNLPKLEINGTETEGISVITNNTTKTNGRAAAFINKNVLSGGESVGLKSYGVAPNGASKSFGIISVADGNSTNGSTCGLRAEAQGAKNNTGVSSVVTNGAAANNSSNIGVFTSVNGSITQVSSNYGLFSSLIGYNVAGSINYGVYATATGNNAFAGYFNGRIFSTNNLVVSDKSLKKDVATETNALQKIAELNPVQYNFIQKNEAGLQLSDKLQHGFIAQELEKQFPELVEEVTHPIFNDKNEQIGTKNLKSVNYIGLISVLTQSVKELSKEIEELKEQLVNREGTYVVTNQKDFTQSELKSINENGFYLGQNLPNPFNTTTKIEYSLPKDEKNASIIVLNLNGQTIKEYKLSDSKGSITIEVGILQKGLYLYSLISNGQEINTKKMLVN